MSVHSFSLTLSSPERTEELGEALGRHLFPGAVAALMGPLGAGKTTLVRGLARALGLSEEYVVASPTFTLLQKYPCRGLDLWHLDLYRIRDMEDAESTGYRDAMEDEGSILVIEWADRVPAVLPPRRLDVVLDYEEEGRVALLVPRGRRYEEAARAAVDEMVPLT